jgi:hypothetical protein
MYTVRGRTAATAATADHGVSAIWNPHATQRIKIVQFSLCAAVAPGSASGIKLRRITARGTAGSTVTPGIQHHSQRGVAPPSVCLCDLAAYSVQPTFDTGDLGLGWILPAVVAAGIIYPIPGGIEVGPGAGLAIVTNAAIIVPASDVAWAWLEDW